MTQLARARLFLVSLAGIAVGLVFTPLPWLAILVPSSLLFVVALMTPPKAPEDAA